MRDVRDAFLALAYELRNDDPGAKAVCVVSESRLSESRLKEELARFRTVIDPSLASRIHFLVNHGDPKRNAVAFGGSLEQEQREFYEWLADLVATERLGGHLPQTSPRQLVVAALAQLRLWNQPPVTIKHLQQGCGVSYPTVASVLKALSEKGWLEESGERGVRLRHLTLSEWMDLARDHSNQRKVQLFTDPTGQSTPERLASRLERLVTDGKLPPTVRIGGVLGASWHFPEVDITSAPRLDVSADADPARIASILDAGFEPKTKPEQRTVLAVHVTRDPWVMKEFAEESHDQWAGELECLADLIEMGFTREATEMAYGMEKTNKRGRQTA
ncbi:MAG: hypothetical protein KA271_03225 [Propionivibrio sp.]|nr:hypothetical protein [Propionivibrio sp.]MBP7780274.1 hypothetical protein [Burkholderiaceae bacterium]